MELWPLRSFSSRLSSACPGTQRGRMAKVRRERPGVCGHRTNIRFQVGPESLRSWSCRAWLTIHPGERASECPPAWWRTAGVRLFTPLDVKKKHATGRHAHILGGISFKRIYWNFRVLWSWGSLALGAF